jgi:acetoin utilization deacetylase AcuC-like enzyme
MVGSFQHPFYPYSGDQSTAPNMCNVPLPAGTRGDVFREKVSSLWMPRLRAFAPQLVLISAGFDAHYEDDMASLGLVESDYAWVTGELMALAGHSAEGRIVSMLEGGYALSALGRSVAAHIRVLAEL